MRITHETRTALSAVRWAPLVAAVACASAQAKAPVERPALEVPPVAAAGDRAAPPPKPAAPEPVGELPPAPPTERRAPDAAARHADRAKPPSPSPRAEPVEPPPVAGRRRPRRRRRSFATPGDPGRPPRRRGRSATARSRAQRCSNDRLPPAHRTPAQASTTARSGSITQAEEALKAGNFVFAQNLAEKAERLAKELQVRRGTDRHAR